jgi:hypothetical protein
MSTNRNAPAERLPVIAKGPLEAEEHYARRLFEAGDMGLRPGQRYPSLVGNGEYAERWRAVMGSSDEQAFYGLEKQRQQDNPDRFIRKERRRSHTAVSYDNARLIGASLFEEAYSAVAYANALGAILSTHVTLVWALLGIEEDNDASALLQSGVIKHIREWSRHKRDDASPPFVWMYAHERGATSGLHTHLLVSVPREQRVDFERWLGKRLARVSRRRPMPKEAVYVADEREGGELDHQWLLFGYLMKTIDPRASLAVFPGSSERVPLADLVRWPHESPGEVRCRRRIGLANEI